METEIEILKKIQESRKKPIGVLLVSRQTGFGPDYIRYICRNLLRKNLVNLKEKDLYLINHRGKKELESRGLIKLNPGVFQKLGCRRLSFEEETSWKPKEIKVKVVPNVNNKIKINLNSPKPKEEKLNFSKKIGRTILALKKLRIFKEDKRKESEIKI